MKIVSDFVVSEEVQIRHRDTIKLMQSLFDKDLIVSISEEVIYPFLHNVDGCLAIHVEKGKKENI